LGQRRGFEPRFPLIHILRASVQRSTPVLFSFVRFFDCGRIIRHPPIKRDSDAILSSGADQMAAHRKLDQRRDDLCGGGLRKRVTARLLSRIKIVEPEWGEAIR
jgi:hypothetical protein